MGVAFCAFLILDDLFERISKRPLKDNKRRLNNMLELVIAIAVILLVTKEMNRD